LGVDQVCRMHANTPSASGEREGLRVGRRIVRVTENTPIRHGAERTGDLRQFQTGGPGRPPRVSNALMSGWFRQSRENVHAIHNSVCGRATFGTEQTARRRGVLIGTRAWIPAKLCRLGSTEPYAHDGNHEPRRPFSGVRLWNEHPRRRYQAPRVRAARS
jgi:hypothetical protein